MKIIQRAAPIALAMMIVAAPAAAQNTIGNAADDAGEAVSDLGTSIANGADAAVNGVSNAADINITTDDTLVTDVNMTDPTMMNEMETVTTETAAPIREQSDKGNWGLLGLAGLLSFLFRPKRADIHLDERSRRA